MKFLRKVAGSLASGYTEYTTYGQNRQERRCDGRTRCLQCREEGKIIRTNTFRGWRRAGYDGIGGYKLREKRSRRDILETPGQDETGSQVKLEQTFPCAM